MMSCSAQWRRAGIAAYGTAPSARFWLALQQDGPWGAQALTQSRLDPALGGRLEAAVRAAGGRISLIRHPVEHSGAGEGPRRVLVAGVGARPWLLSGQAENPAVLEGLPWAALAAGDAAAVRAALPWLAPDHQPALLVCVNAKRDACCAVHGRSVAIAAEAAHPGLVWEANHLGGHRFAATAVVLPTGQLLARLTDRLAGEAVAAAALGRLPSGGLGEFHDRGLCRLSPVQQVADSHVRALTGETDPGALSVRTEGEWQLVGHVDGRRWRLLVTSVVTGDLPASCGAGPEPVREWRVEG